MRIKSQYRGRDKDEFISEIIGEGEDMGEPAYLCLLEKEYREQFQDGDKPFLIRKSLVGEGRLYRLMESEIVQLKLF